MAKHTAGTLNPAATQALRTRLLQRIDELNAEVRGAHDAAAEQIDRLSGEVRDSADSAEDDRGNDVRHAETERDIAELLDAQEALRRMDDGSYGRCIDCERPIAPQRLQVQPSARRCAECQSDHEKRHPGGPNATGHPLMTDR